MSRFLAKIVGIFSNRTMVGIDKTGNRYFARNEVIDGVMKEKRWVVFKGEQEPTSVPVEWICWLNGQRKRAPTAEEMAEMEARREQVRQNVARLKKEEEERRAVQGTIHRHKIPGKASGPDLQSFLQQVRSEDDDHDETSVAAGSTSEAESKKEKTVQPQEAVEPQTTEPTGSGSSFQPGVWKPPSRS